jgi:hypothetical protein
MNGSKTVPPKDQSTRVREIGWIIFNGLSRLDHNSHFFFADAPLIHTLDRMNSKDCPLKNHIPNLTTNLGFGKGKKIMVLPEPSLRLL